MIHHAVLGSMERFIAMLLEHYEGWLPLWLAPDQVTVATVSDASAAYGQRVTDALDAAGLRVLFDDRPERLERKIVDAREQRVPVFLTVGTRDERDETVSLRLRDGTQSTLCMSEGIERLREMALPPVKAGGTNVAC
jgi:threonyl-tRNA synthetase